MKGSVICIIKGGGLPNKLGMMSFAGDIYFSDFISNQLNSYQEIASRYFGFKRITEEHLMVPQTTIYANNDGTEISKIVNIQFFNQLKLNSLYIS
jgi:hypothetical protein